MIAGSQEHLILQRTGTFRVAGSSGNIGSTYVCADERGIDALILSGIGLDVSLQSEQVVTFRKCGGFRERYFNLSSGSSLAEFALALPYTYLSDVCLRTLQVDLHLVYSKGIEVTLRLDIDGEQFLFGGAY